MAWPGIAAVTFAVWRQRSAGNRRRMAAASSSRQQDDTVSA
jgi:hypothetical protein